MNLVLHGVAGNEHLGRGGAEHIVDAVPLVLKLNLKKGLGKESQPVKKPAHIWTLSKLP